MAIIWPTSPNIGDTVTGPRGEIWEWDGDKWVSLAGPPPAPPGPNPGDVRFDSGKLEQWDGSAWVEIPLGGWPVQGVPGGTPVVAGQVGETSIGGGSGIFLNTSDTNIQMTGGIFLSSGDWDVFANAFFTNQSGTTTTQLRISINSPTAITPGSTGQSNWLGSSTGSVTLWAGPQRVDTAVSLTVYLNVFGSFSGGLNNVLCTYRMAARRMR